MSQPLAQTTCRIHFDRPATARCPSCEQFYCRECITDHDGRMTCAACLKKEREEAVKPKKAKSGLHWFQPAPLIHFSIALAVAWVLFYLVAKTLTGIPDDFHDGTIWTP